MPSEYVDMPIYLDELASALAFTPADLETNRTGRLSLSQRATQFRAIAKSIAVSTGCLLLAGGCTLAAVIIG